MAIWCHLDLSSTFVVISNTLLLYKISSYGLSDSYVSGLHCYITSGYSFVWIHIIYLTPSEVLSGVSPRICPWASLISLLLFFAILLNTQNIFCLLALWNCSISSATDSTLPKSDIDSICMVSVLLTLWNLILMKLKSEVQCWLCIVLIKQNVGTHMYIDLLFFYYSMFLIVTLHPS